MNIIEKERFLQKMDKEELIDLLVEYDKYIIKEYDKIMDNKIMYLFEFIVFKRGE